MLKKQFLKQFLKQVILSQIRMISKEMIMVMVTIEMIHTKKDNHFYLRKLAELTH